MMCLSTHFLRPVESMNRLLRLRPVQSAMIVVFPVMVGVVVQGLATSPTAFVVGDLTVVLVVTGWSVMLTNNMSSRANDRRRVLCVRAAFAVTIVVHAVFLPLLINSRRGSDSWNVLSPIAAVLGAFAPAYIFWSAARLLVGREGGKTGSWDRCIGTFFLLMFLPLGILSIQKRVLRILGSQAVHG
jgi:hypothetical protein